MPNAKARIGKNQINFSNFGRDSIGLKLSLKDRLKLSKAGAKNLIAGTIAANRKKKKR